MSAHKMKDSGIEWIGEIPEEWEISKVSYFYKISLGKMLQPNAKEESDTLENYLCALNVFWNKITTDNIKQMWFAKSEKKQYELTAGDLIVTEGGDVAAACIWEGEVNPCYIQNAVYRVRSLPGFLNKYLYYHLFVAKTTGYIDMLCNKATIAHFTKDKFSNLPFIVLPLDEQKKIVEYLDEKCSAIDQIVASKQKQNEQLAEYRQSLITEAVTKGLNPAAPMKDSDIEWIGEIPEKWEISKIKHLLSTPITDGPHETPEILEEGIPFISAEAVKNLKVNFELKRGFISQIDHERFCKKCKPQFGDIFMVKSGATTGNIARVDTHEEFSIWSPLALIRVKNTVIKRDYMFYFLQSNLFRLQVELFWSYGTQQNIGMEVLENLYAPYPSLGMQQKIAAYLDKKCDEIDALSGRNKNIIESLQEYKQSLIYEAVTGKIEL